MALFIFVWTFWTILLCTRSSSKLLFMIESLSSLIRMLIFHVSSAIRFCQHTPLTNMFSVLTSFFYLILIINKDLNTTISVDCRRGLCSWKRSSIKCFFLFVFFLRRLNGPVIKESLDSPKMLYLQFFHLYLPKNNVRVQLEEVKWQWIP